jgi:quinol monooxygenase YgiN
MKGTPQLAVRGPLTATSEATVLIVAGTFTIEPAERDAFLASRHDGMRRSRAEAGCLEYTFSADPLDPTRVLLFERWEDQASLDAHLAAQATAPKPDADSAPAPAPTAVSIIMYDVSGERTMV